MALPYTFGTQTGSIPLNELDENFQYLENFVPPLAVAAATVTAAAQPAITSLGTLTGLSCSGTITSGTINASLINGTIQTGNQPNITKIGTLADLTVSNTLIVGTVTATQLVGLSSITGTLSTPNQPAITGVGVLNSLSVTGNVQSGNLRSLGSVSAIGNISGSYLFGNGSQLTGIYGNSNVADYLATFNGPISGSVLSVTGNVTASSNVNTGALSAVGNITGGNLITNGQVTAVGNLSASNLNTTGQVTAVGNLSASNLNTTGLISATGNVTGSNYFGSTLSVSGNITGSALSISGTSNLTGVATAPTAANGTSNTQIATTAFVQNSLLNILPSGVIVMWSGSIASIPSSWLLCDGTNGTPDLRDRFIIGAGNVYNPGSTGGSANAIVVAHTHTANSVVTDPGHLHSYTAPSGTDTGGTLGGAVVDTTTTANTSTASTGITVVTTVNSSGSSGTNANLPPYYALAYIMKA